MIALSSELDLLARPSTFVALIDVLNLSSQRLWSTASELCPAITLLCCCSLFLVVLPAVVQSKAAHACLLVFRTRRCGSSAFGQFTPTIASQKSGCYECIGE